MRRRTKSRGGGCDDAATTTGSEEPLAPVFEVDPLWPKNLPNHWLMGPTVGVDVDSSDTIWLVHRNTPDQFVASTEIGLAQDPPLSECCRPGPPVLAFDQEGNLVYSWGGPGPRRGTTSGLRLTTESRSTTWTTCGSVAMGRLILTF